MPNRKVIFSKYFVWPYFDIGKKINDLTFGFIISFSSTGNKIIVIASMLWPSIHLSLYPRPLITLSLGQKFIHPFIQVLGAKYCV